MSMTVVKGEFPPNIDEIDRAFDSKRLHGILYAHGKFIYNPSSVDVPPWLVAHEAVHGYRQMHPDVPDAAEAEALEGMSIDDRVARWWFKYIHDKDFRFAEELAAHAAEYRYFYRAHPNDRRIRRVFLQAVAERLAGPLYGRLLTVERAKEQIKRIALDASGGSL